MFQGVRSQPDADPPWMARGGSPIDGVGDFRRASVHEWLPSDK